MLKPYQSFALVLYPLTVLFLSTTLAGRIPPSYFSNSHNPLNVYFVKLGWLWTTLAFGSLVVFQSPKRSAHALVRYIGMTLYWIIMTQWLLGPSFVDRMFILTGGTCNYDQSEGVVLQQATCRAVGGSWQGGHDVSGHCVLLIHASMFLWEELMQVDKKKRVMALAINGVWYWMLCMTSIYFHGYRELLSGTFFGIVGWASLVSASG
ncbi:inositol phospholipid synthesis and fat-storage-inducing TM-domain-containing protein [Fennellomyces sp. T-0311]|nr:inositol phospholipid synthesis and fat-storage-inducing TM-domain-containing protein [Fennellomyces sp. T-0311]